MNPGVQIARLAQRPVLTPWRLAALLATLALLGLAAGISAGSEGWSLAWAADADLIQAIRAPRSLGALAAGALLGLAGALAQGLFRNPLADPYLLGSAAGAGLGVVLVLAGGAALAAGALLGLAGALAQGLFRNPLADPYLLGSAAGAGLGVVLVLAGGSALAGTAVLAQLGWVLDTGLVLAAFCGALGGVGLTLVLAGGAARPLQLLLCGVVVGVLMGAVSDLLLMASPEALRGRQVFLLGTTGFLGWTAVGWLAGALALVLPLALRFARALDALVLGESSASSLGLRLPVLRLLLVGLMALATGTAVSQVGLVGFVGLVAPHLVRRLVAVTHRAQLALSAAAGGVLLLAADVLARSAIAPQELPVGVLTAVLGGSYLLVLLRRQGGGR